MLPVSSPGLHSSPLAEQDLPGPDSGCKRGSDLLEKSKRGPALLQLRIHWGDQNTTLIAKPFEATLA